jgi:hypothetical protein
MKKGGLLFVLAEFGQGTYLSKCYRVRDQMARMSFNVLPVRQWEKKVEKGHCYRRESPTAL